MNTPLHKGLFALLLVGALAVPMTLNAAAQATPGESSLSTSNLLVGRTAVHELPTAVGALATLSHSASQVIVGNNSAACHAAGLHRDNSYLREFDLNFFAVGGNFKVTEVEFGVETAVAADPVAGQPLTVNLYIKTVAADPLTWANLTPIGTADATVFDQALSLLTVPVTGTAPAGSVLVVEVFTPDGQLDGNKFFIGSNADGETAPGYIAAGACGMPEPVELATTGFVNMHIVMNVTGDDVPAQANYTVTGSVSTPGGTIAPSGPQAVANGATATYTLTPDVGYDIDHVGGTCGGSLVGNIYTTGLITDDCTVIAHFVLNHVPPPALVPAGSSRTLVWLALLLAGLGLVAVKRQIG